MSDDEGPDDYSGVEIDEVDPALEPDEPEEDLEVEDAAGSSDDETDDDTAPAADDAVDDAPLPAEIGSKATPATRARIDPVLRVSNRPRIVKIVPPEERITDNRLHRTEAAYILAMRADQIDKHATAFTDTTGLTDAVAIAYKELFDRKCPMILRRTVGIGPVGELLVEEWDVRTMTLPAITAPASLQ